MYRAASIFIIVGGVLVLAVLLHATLPVGYDYSHWYWPIPRAWLAGETRLYDAAAAQFFSPPWTVWLLLPFSLLDAKWGMTALTLISLSIVGVVTTRVATQTIRSRSLSPSKGSAARPALIAAAVMLCPYTLAALLVGTLDPWALAGIYGAYLTHSSITQHPLTQRGSGLLPRPLAPWLFSAALLLLATRPQQCWLTVPALLIGLRAWSREDVVRGLALPIVVLLATFPLFGIDWPLRLATSYGAAPPYDYLVTSTYSVAQVAGIPVGFVAFGVGVLSAYALLVVWREGMSLETLGLVMTANAVVAPYINSQSYLTLLALPWAMLAARRPWVATALYLISLPLLLRPLGLWDRVGLLDVTFPLLLAAVLLWERARTRAALREILGPQAVEPELSTSYGGAGSPPRTPSQASAPDQ